LSRQCLSLLASRRKHASGSILVLAIWVLVFFSILCVALAGIISSQIRITKRIEEKIIGKYLAKAAVIYAREERLTREAGYDTLYELKQKKEQELGIGKFSYTLADEESKININTAGAEAIASLPGFDLKLAEKVSSSLLKPFQLKEQVLLVDGVTEEVFEQCKDFITVYTDGKVNINTAPEEVLKALGIGEELAGAIVDFRNGRDSKEATEDDEIFENTGEIINKLRTSRGMSEEEEAALASLIGAGALTVASKNFSLEIDTKIMDKPAMRYIIVIDDEKIKQWREY